MTAVFGKLFGKDRSSSTETPPDTVIYAVGDVHGRADLLAPLLQAIVADAAETPVSRRVFVFVGDYVDRGPDSKRVIQLLAGLQKAPGVEAHFLCGNHDETLLAFLTEPASGPTWCDYGGRETLASYGVTPPVARTDSGAWAEAAAAFGQALPPEHRSFLEGLQESVTVGDYFFAHAGARPGTPLHLQSRRDMLWIREPFLEDDRRFEKVVVHGHTPAEAVHSDARRVGIDTGAYATGVLTAVRLQDADRRFIQAVARPGGAPEILQEPADARRAYGAGRG